MDILDNIFKNSLYYAMYDLEGEQSKPFRTHFTQLRSLNEQGHGIFRTVHGFNNRRIKANLTNINAWYVDTDDGSKKEQLDRIKQSPLPPSMIIETKRGYHVYWFSKNGTVINFSIIMKRLVELFKGDKNAKDLSRILRVPVFNHCKDPNDKYLVKIIYFKEVYYSELEMIYFFKCLENEKPKSKRSNKKNPISHNHIDCKFALEKLSGTDHINGDVIEFYPNNDGTEQIWVNAKSTSCWLDREGLIGSHDNGGPTIYQWVNWYHQDMKINNNIIKEVFNV
ncbi:hypothetical protein BVY03_05835 [bacterium K02(2017)]|nr:hypothetical protein BVY03_05835 [bacterium K02(2017)]